MNQLSEGALATRHIPHATSHLINDDRWLTSVFCLLTPHKLLQRIIAAIDNGKKTISLLLATKEHTIESQPLGTGQRRGFHILSTLDDGDADLLQTPIATTVLERRQEECVRPLVDDLLHHRTHALANIRNPSCLYLILNPRNLDILQISHARDTVLLVKRHQHGAMNRRKHDGTTQGRADDGRGLR